MVTLRPLNTRSRKSLTGRGLMSILKDIYKNISCKETRGQSKLFQELNNNNNNNYYYNNIY